MSLVTSILAVVLISVAGSLSIEGPRARRAASG